MKRTWIIEPYNSGTRAVAFEVITGGREPLLGDVYDGPTWLFYILHPSRRQPLTVRREAFDAR